MALLAAASFTPGMGIEGYGNALIAVLVIGILNALVRPLLVLLTLPVTVLTLGLFLLVINAILLWLAAYFMDSLVIQGFGAAFLGSLIYSLLGLAIDTVLQRLFAK